MGKAIRKSRLKASKPKAPPGTVDWLNYWLKAAEGARDRFDFKVTNDLQSYVENQYKYWQNVASGIKWLIAQAEGRAH